MLKLKLKYVLLSLLLVLTVLSTSLSTSLADDLDIYKISSGSNAKIMFVVDASGSMLANLEGKHIDCGYSDAFDTNEECYAATRMSKLKEAFENTIKSLDGTQGLGVGLTWFGGPVAGGIKFPITDINKKFDMVKGEFSTEAGITTDVGDVLISMVKNLHTYNDYTASYSIFTGAVGRLSCVDKNDKIVLTQNNQTDCDYSSYHYPPGSTGFATTKFATGGASDKYSNKFNTLAADVNRLTTPTVDVLYETARYFRGDYVLYGTKDTFAPWNAAAKTYKNTPEKQTLHSLGEIEERYIQPKAYAFHFTDLVPSLDVDGTGRGGDVLGTPTDPFLYVEGNQHRSGPLLGWRAANPLSYELHNGAIKTRKYNAAWSDGGSSDKWARSELTNEPPIIGSYCSFEVNHYQDGGSNSNFENKWAESWFRCNVKEDPATYSPTNDEQWANLNPGFRNGIIHCFAGGVKDNKEKLAFVDSYQYDKTVAQFLVEMLIARADAFEGGSSGGGGKGNAAFCTYQYESSIKYKSPLNSCSKGAIVLITDGHPTANVVDYEQNKDSSDGSLTEDDAGDNPALVRRMIQGTDDIANDDCDSVGVHANDLGDGGYTPGPGVGKNIVHWKVKKWDSDGDPYDEFKRLNLSEETDSVIRQNIFKDNLFHYGRCGSDLTKFLRDNSQVPTVTENDNDPGGYGTVDTYTVAFAITDTDETAVTTPYLKGLSDGKHYEAGNTAALESALNAIITSITGNISDEASAPAIVLDKQMLRTDNWAYVPMFKPEPKKPSWLGNIKGYDLTSSEFRNMEDPEVDQGGLNAVIADLGNNRNLFVTATDTATEIALDATTLLNKDNDILTRAMIGMPGNAADAADVTADAPRNELIDDFRKSTMADSIHSKPVMVQYDTNNKVLFAVSNRGLLHAFDVSDKDNVEELWGFMPYAAVGSIYEQIQNDPDSTNDHIYTLDSPIRVWYHDEVSTDGEIGNHDDDFVRLYFGMRRGGTYHYAVDVTDIDKPKQMWRIKAGENNFKMLGETWSPITLVKLRDKSVPVLTDGSGGERVVAVFAGGYRTDNQDDVANTIRAGALECNNGMIDSNADGINEDCKAVDGLGIYIVDAKTGVFLNSIGPNTGVAVDADPVDKFKAVEDRMKYAIPSELRVISSNGDGYADRIYFGDMGGQLWRVDIKGDESNGGIKDANALSATLLADLGVNSANAADQSSHRKFFFPPAVALVSIDTNIKKYAIAIGSGQRSNPLHGRTATDVPVEDKFYLIYDNGTTPNPAITESDLADATSADVPVASTAPGWMVALKLNSGSDNNQWEGEKSITSPIIFDNKVMFLTFIPKAEEQVTSGDSCLVKTNTQNLFYSLKLTTAASAIEIDPNDSEKDKFGNVIKLNKDKIAVTIPTSFKFIDQVVIVNDPPANGAAADCYSALAGQSRMARFCKTPSKVYWKQTK